MYWKLRVKVGEARHVYITGSRPLPHSYANEIIEVNGSTSKQLCFVKLPSFIL